MDVWLGDSLRQRRVSQLADEFVDPDERRMPLNHDVEDDASNLVAIAD